MPRLINKCETQYYCKFKFLCGFNLILIMDKSSQIKQKSTTKFKLTKISYQFYFNDFYYQIFNQLPLQSRDIQGKDLRGRFLDNDDYFQPVHNLKFCHILLHMLVCHPNKIFLNFRLISFYHMGTSTLHLEFGNISHKDHCDKFQYIDDFHKSKVFCMVFHRKKRFLRFHCILRYVQSDGYIGIFEVFERYKAHRHLCDKFVCNYVRCNLKVYRIHFHKQVKFRIVQFGQFYHRDTSYFIKENLLKCIQRYFHLFIK